MESVTVVVESVTILSEVLWSSLCMAKYTIAIPTRIIINQSHQRLLLFGCTFKVAIVLVLHVSRMITSMAANCFGE